MSSFFAQHSRTPATTLGRARTVVPLVLWSMLIAGSVLHTGTWAAGRANIYLIDDGSGSIHLSNRPDGQANTVVVAHDDPAHAPLDAAAKENPAAADTSRGAHPGPAVLDSRLTEIVRKAALAQRVAPELLHAVIAAESGYATRAVSARGAQGLMQLMPATAQGYGVTDPFDARQNVQAGAQHLRRLLDQFGQSKTLALAAYNAGAAAVVRYHHSVPPFAETMAYVPRVLQHYADLQRQGLANRPLRSMD